jgi:hypothetical protein
MPVGGNETGIGRFPELGEQILVAEKDSEYYLLGYIPSGQQPFGLPPEGTAPAEAVEDEGFALRYKQSAGDRGTVGKHSEIAFYNKETHWKTAATDPGNAVVDHIDITSTGDRSDEAANYHRIKANRLEILSNCEGPDHTKTNGEIDTGKDAAGTDVAMPLGDVRYDDHLLHKGDIHIRAKKRVVIKAGSSICLQVGHSVLTLSDTTLSAVCRMVNQNLPYTWDSVLTLSRKSTGKLAGAILAGPAAVVSGGTSVFLGESWGGGFSSDLGNVKVSGRDIQSSTLTGLDYIAEVGKNMGEIAMNASGFGKNNAHDLDGKAVMDYMKYARKIWNALISFTVTLTKRVMANFANAERRANEQEEADRNAAVDRQIERGRGYESVESGQLGYESEASQE